MITSFEVGAVFRIVNEATAPLRAILKQVRELRTAIGEAKTEISSLAKMPSLAAASGEAKALATEWRSVAKAATSANRAIGNASKRSLVGPGVTGVAEANSLADAWERVAAASSAARGNARSLTSAAGRGPGGGGGGGAGGGRRHQPGFMSRLGSAHLAGGPSAAIPGGAHINFSGGAAAAAGLLGYGAYEAAEMEDVVFQLMYHSGVDNTDANKTKFRKILQDSMIESGYGLHEIGEAARKEIMQMQGTPGGGIDVLPEMLRGATIESRLKGESPAESMNALLGLGHMTKQYDPDGIKKLVGSFAFLSTANPSSLGSIEKAAGYAVPLLQSGLEIDPMQSLLMGTALTRAGATSTKSGTWLREMALRAMPGTSMMSKIAFKKHAEALKAFGLVDDKDKPTWFTDDKPDLFKMLEIASSHAASIPLSKRASYERALFGAQGGGGFALLADPAVREQVTKLQHEMNSPEFKARYGTFMQRYNNEVTAQGARSAMQDFNVTMMDIGSHVLPSVNGALKDFKAMLEGIRNSIPGASTGNGGALMGKRGLEGATAGAAVGGIFGGVPGAVIGGIGGGVLGVAEGYLEQQAAQNKVKWDEEAKQRSKANLDAIKGQPGASGGVFPGGTQRAPTVHLSVNLDGRAIAQAVSDQQAANGTYQTDSSSSNGGAFYGP